jgi:predicted histidine transporter YuiF (NhaC family)
MPNSPHDRYSRWQGLAIAQLSVAVALLSALSVAGLSTGLSLLQNKEFMSALQYKTIFALSFLFFVIAAFASCITVVTRTMDFRLTARVVREGRGQVSHFTGIWET